MHSCINRKGFAMKKSVVFLLSTLILGVTLTGGCGKNDTEIQADGATATFDGTLRVLNIKSEVNEQINALAKEYTKETGIAVEILEVPAGVDAQATLKGYYLSDQMPDIIACEASGFSNWEGLLVDMSD